MARRARLCRPRRALPVPAGPGLQPGRHRDRPVRAPATWARSRRGWASRCRPRSRWSCSPMASRRSGGAAGGGWLHGLEGGRGRGRGAGRARHDALACARPRARDAGGRRRRRSCWRCRRAGDRSAPSCSAASSAWLFCGSDAPVDHAALPHRGRPHAPARRCSRCSSSCWSACRCWRPRCRRNGIELVDAFYRAGSLVFGGGHVVLPLLQASVVPPGWVSNDAFLAGYGAAQAVPGPLFTFAAYLGAVMGPQPNGWVGAALCLVAIFLPSFLLVIGALPFWEELRRRPLGAGGAARRQRGGGRAAARRALQSGVDGGHRRARRFRARPSRPSCCCSCGRRRPGWWWS